MEFISVVNSLGSLPLFVLIVVIFILLLKEVKKDNEITRTALQKMEERIRIIEQDYAEKSYVQEINSNWRTEIRRIDEKLDKILMGK